MKTNEAPKKIYIDGCSSFACETTDDSIEYIRADVFIKKACEWLEKNTFFELNLDFGYSLQIKEFVDEFRKYMEGE